MKDKVTNTKTGTILFHFQQLTTKTVDKYCSLHLPYKPGLYSIHWESSYKTSGLLNELNTTAAQLMQDFRASHSSADITKFREQLDALIYKSLLQYLEKVYDTDYADSEQPEWMIRIAERLYQNGHFSF